MKGKKAMSSPIIHTEELTKAFGQHTAVDHLNLDVMPGDVFGFLGPNGAGKTTTIRMLLGLIRPTEGRALIFGMDTRSRRREILLRTGAVIETPVFYPYLSGRDNLRVLASASGMDWDRRSNTRIEAVLELMDLSKFADDPYHTYSLGMKERLGIGAALLADPELILLDEPTNGLDPAGVREIRQLIPALAAQGKTIFLTSHLLYEIQQVCNRVAILYRGKLLQQGDVSDLLQDGEGVVVRLRTPQETQRAWEILEQARSNSSPWIGEINLQGSVPDDWALQVRTPIQHSAEITALLAYQNLFVSELAPQRASLEDFFLQLTDNPESSNQLSDRGAPYSKEKTQIRGFPHG
jgi:ABC-2 type transport system ATP-binding protein